MAINKYLSILTTLVFMLFACEKPKDFYDELGKGSYLTLVSAQTQLDGTDPNAFIRQVVNSYGEPVKTVKIYTSATPTLDKTKWKLIKEVPFSGDTELKVTNKELATALGLVAGQLSPGSTFSLYNELITEDGRVFNSINNSAGDLENQLAFNVAFRWTATIVCPYNAATVVGKYKVVRDDWEDWSVGDEVEVVAGPGANQFSLEKVYPNPAFAVVVKPLIATVNPSSGTLTFPINEVWGNYGSYQARTLDGSGGFVFSCTGRISVNLRIGIPGDIGFYKLELQK